MRLSIKNLTVLKKCFYRSEPLLKKFLPNIFELPGGHIDFGEDITLGLQRELFEEFGMKSNIGDSFFAFTYTNEVKGSHSIEVVYFAKFIGQLKDISLNPEDHSEFGWFAESELSKATT